MTLAQAAVRPLLVATALLTRIPVRTGPVTPEDLRNARTAFALVGAGVGLTAAGGGLLVSFLLGWPAGALAAVVTAVLITGALHEDGLADTADGLWGAWEPVRRREIMRDSRLGTYGVLALVFALTARVGLLFQLGPALALQALVAAHVLSRLGMVVLSVWLSPAAPGSGAAVSGPMRGPVLFVTVGLAMLPLVAALGVLTPLPVLTAAGVLVGCAVLARRALGGLTGDVLGAAGVVVEITVLVTMAVLARQGMW